MPRNEDYTVFFDKLGMEGKQYIIDSDDEEFRDAAIRFLTEKCSFRGYSSASREILVSMADEREKEAMKDSPNRFSIREVPYEAGRVGIWDASIKKYLGENGQLYLFAEQADAEEYLKRIQRENGIPETIIVTDGDGRTEGEVEADKAEDAELTAVSRFLHATRMEDIDLSFDMGEIVARDSDNEWRGKDFYEFLLNDAIALDENRNPVDGISIPDEILNPVIELAEKYGANIESVSRHEPDELDRAKDYIREYLIREFDEQEDHFDDLAKIELAYTTVGDEDIPVQTEVDLEKYQLRMYLRDVLVETIQFESLRDMNDNLLCGLDFGGLTEVTEEQIEAYHRETTPVIPPPMEPPKPRKTLPVYNSHPEIPNSEKHNYRITDNEIGMGGPKAKFRKNIEAIRLLYALEAENRLATPEEQEILAQYSGWGGLADAFDSTKDNWNSEYNELKNLLTPEEYEAANESTLTAFYTPPMVIKAMYKALENMGFKRGNILEPSCGVGNFMGLLPDSMDAKMYGVELDSISGRIARQLYQKNGITIDGYERTQFPDSIFDVAVGNVPFNDFKLVDKR